ncbi:hypothetical protein F5882DRAFT_393862 [Hyaloscypha sp. PMI_1271]|nr:hypothetical protein F5882DRAFT_393862 [Hyaloscypha sp. PMI_1271]
MARFLTISLLLTFLTPLALTAPTSPSNAALQVRQEYGVYYNCYPSCYNAKTCSCPPGDNFQCVTNPCCEQVKCT